MGSVCAGGRVSAPRAAPPEPQCRGLPPASAPGSAGPSTCAAPCSALLSFSFSFPPSLARAILSHQHPAGLCALFPLLLARCRPRHHGPCPSGASCRGDAEPTGSFGGSPAPASALAPPHISACPPPADGEEQAGAVGSAGSPPPCSCRPESIRLCLRAGREPRGWGGRGRDPPLPVPAGRQSKAWGCSQVRAGC